MAELIGRHFFPGDTVGKSWKFRAIKATKGNTTQLGAVLIAMLGKAATHSPPRYGHTAIVTADGWVCSKFQNRNGAIDLASPIAKVEELRDEMRKLADHIKATDAERIDMLMELRKWISKDYRAAPPSLEGKI